eukprot:363661-Chlamydomonas_euryale.AAC.4
MTHGAATDGGSPPRPPAAVACPVEVEQPLPQAAAPAMPSDPQTRGAPRPHGRGGPPEAACAPPHGSPRHQLSPAAQAGGDPSSDCPSCRSLSPGSPPHGGPPPNAALNGGAAHESLPRGALHSDPPTGSAPCGGPEPCGSPHGCSPRAADVAPAEEPAGHRPVASTAPATASALARIVPEDLPGRSPAAQPRLAAASASATAPAAASASARLEELPALTLAAVAAALDDASVVALGGCCRRLRAVLGDDDEQVWRPRCEAHGVRWNRGGNWQPHELNKGKP